MAFGAFVSALSAGCGSSDSFAPPAAPEPYIWALPTRIRPPVVPEDNPMTEAKAELGRLLFYDRRLSSNQSQACASCHLQERSFSEPKAVSIGSTGQTHARNANGLANVAFASSLTWANPVLTKLETQNALPLFGEDPLELGALGHEEEILARLKSDSRYEAAFASAFPDVEDPVKWPYILRALASFQRSLLSFDAAYDRYVSGQDPSALSPEALRGMELFFSERLECFHCHGGALFSDATVHEGSGFVEKPFFNTGLYNLDGEGAYPANNPGVFELSGRPEDMGRFRAPSLRNVEVSGPYMHDGSVPTLSGVIDIYARGGRKIDSGPYAGDGRESPLKSSFVSGFSLSPEEKADLLAFLRSLTDRSFLENPKFANPWASP